MNLILLLRSLMTMYIHRTDKYSQHNSNILASLKLVRDMIIIYSQMHRADKYPQQLNHFSHFG